MALTTNRLFRAAPPPRPAPQAPAQPAAPAQRQSWLQRALSFRTLGKL